LNAFETREARVALALLLGLLLGVERERRKRTRGHGAIAGLRTFTLVGLLGGIAAYVDLPGLVVTGGLVVGALVVVGYALDPNREQDAGLTTEVALVLTYALGALALYAPRVAGSAAIASTLLLHLRTTMHRFVRETLRDDELHDALLLLGVLRPDAHFAADFAVLEADRRAARLATGSGAFWVAAERIAHARWLFPDAAIPASVGAAIEDAPADEDTALADVLRGHLGVTGPATPAALAARTGLSDTAVARGLASLEATGYAMQGHFDPACDEVEFCARHLLARIHAYTQKRLRSEIEPVTARDFMRFLLRWHHVAPGTQREGRAGTLAVIEQLQGFELAAGAWEREVLPRRIAGYRSEWLDDLCWSGEAAWGRLGLPDAIVVRTGDEEAAPGRGPSRATPITLARRNDLAWLLASARGAQQPAPASGDAARVRDVIGRASWGESG
jgi:hypothetical protein